jgi:DNA polymerase III subunit epsilon
MGRADSPAARAYRTAPLPNSRAPWREVTFCVIDVETTGLDPASDEIISFATVTVAGGMVRLDDARYELVRPGRMPNADTVRIHGLREADLFEATPMSDLLDGLLGAITERALVAHVAAVERGFLGAALSANGLELRNPIVDTAALDRELRRLRHKPPVRREPVGLSDMARALGLPVHRPHHADGDALTTAQAFIALATHLEAFAPQTLDSLERLSRSQQRPSAGLRALLSRFGIGRAPG